MSFQDKLKNFFKKKEKPKPTPLSGKVAEFFKQLAYAGIAALLIITFIIKVIIKLDNIFVNDCTNYTN